MKSHHTTPHDYIIKFGKHEAFRTYIIYKYICLHPQKRFQSNVGLTSNRKNFLLLYYNTHKAKTQNPTIETKGSPTYHYQLVLLQNMFHLFALNLQHFDLLPLWAIIPLFTVLFTYLGEFDSKLPQFRGFRDSPFR